MRHAEFSHDLFGRHHALFLYSTIDSLVKPEFSTGQLATLSGIASPVVSKELGRLVDLGVLERIGYRGQYRRDVESPFWDAVRSLTVVSDARPMHRGGHAHPSDS